MSAIYKSAAAEAAVHAAYRQVLDGWPIPHQELRIPTAQGETFVVACGPQDAPPLIALHGAQANAAAWMFDCLEWARHFRVYAIDMIGEAGFSAPSRPPLDGDAHARWLDEVLVGLGVARAAFVGVSLGGWLALDYANRRPAKVERLALLCPAGIGRQKNFLLKAAPLLLLGPWGASKVGELVFGPRPTEVPEAAKPFVAMMDLIVAGVRPRAIAIPRLSDAELAALSMPVLAILGGRDVLLRTDETRDRLQRHAPHAQIRWLPDARHYIPGQAGAILDFLRA